MKFGYLAVIGTCIAVIAYSVGLAQFSGAWWAFVLATSTLAVVLSKAMASPATP